jgi:hypothetical protein
MVREVVAWVKAQGGEPCIVPAMGSHGGATPAGQQAVLEGYGVTECTIGTPIRSSLQVVKLPQGEAETTVFMDRVAAEADGTIILNRIKPHTDYHGPYESGLVKMLVIGLGNHAQARAIHTLGVYGLRTVIPQVARQVLTHGNVLLGLGIVENAYDETLLVRAVPAARIFEAEPALLEEARRRLPRLPMDDLDILIIDEMGKDISGVGMDTNVIGRMMIHGEPEPATPRIRHIIVRGITPASHGNACGMGLADIATRRFADQIDHEASYENMVTSSFLHRAKTPLIAETDLQALQWALRGCGSPKPEDARIARIRNTAHVADLWVSDAALRDLAEREDITVLGPVGKTFTESGELAPLAPLAPEL